jgi:hypothetical protein
MLWFPKADVDSFKRKFALIVNEPTDFGNDAILVELTSKTRNRDRKIYLPLKMKKK